MNLQIGTGAWLWDRVHISTLCALVLAACCASGLARATAAPEPIGEVEACTKAIVQMQPAGDSSVAGLAQAPLGAIGKATMHPVAFRREDHRAADPAPGGAGYRDVRRPRPPTPQDLIAARLKESGLVGVSDVMPLEALPNTYVFRFGASRVTPAIIERLRSELTRRGFRLKYAEASYRVHAATEASAIDPDYGKDGAGQLALKSVSADRAWPRIRITQNLRKTIVAVIDTGIDAGHLDLIHEIWHPDPNRQSDLPADKNAQPYGKTFMDGSSEDDPPADGEASHGTLVAGIIAAEGDNPYAVKSVTLRGVAQLITARITTIDAPAATGKAGNAGAQGDPACTDNLIRAIDYVIDPYGAVDPPSVDFEPFTSVPADNSEISKVRARADGAGGATVLNLSNFQLVRSEALEYYLKWLALYFHKVLLVAAVRDNFVVLENGSKAIPNIEMDDQFSFPASYGLPNVLAVTGSTAKKCLNYAFGAKVDIAAPSDSMLSTVALGDEKSSYFLAGTSAATPFVSGTAALVQYLGPASWGYQEVKEAILRSAQNMCVVGSPSQKTDYEHNCPVQPDIQKTAHLARNADASLCKAVLTNGVLDVDAATTPPILGQVIGADGKRHNGIAILPSVPLRKYPSGGSITVSWQPRAPAPSNFSNADLPLCPLVDIDLIGGKALDDLSDPSRAPLASRTSVDIALGSQQLALPSVVVNTRVWVRIQCTNSHLFRLSDRITITPP